MKRRLLTVLITTVFAITAFGGAAFAVQDNPGEPGQPNCFGQRTAYHATGGDGSQVDRNPAQRAKDGFAGDTTVKEVQQRVKSNCEHPGNSNNAPGQN